MDKYLVKKIIYGTILISLLTIGIFFILFENPKNLILGFLFGLIIGILGFKLLHTTISRAVNMKPKKANLYTAVHYNLRYLIYFVVLSVSAIAEYLSFPGAVLGLLMVKITIFFLSSLGIIQREA